MLELMFNNVNSRMADDIGEQHEEILKITPAGK